MSTDESGNGEPASPLEEIEAMTIPAVDRVSCSECGKLLTRSSISGHLRKIHGVYIRRPRGRPPGSKNKKSPSTPRKAPTSLSMVPHRPEPLTAEQVTQVTASLLWPDGIPPDRLEHLLRWHIQTAVFLDMAQNSE